MKNSQEKVFILGSYAPSLINFRGDLIRNLVGLGCDVHVAAPEIDDEVGGKLSQMGCKWHCVPMERTGVSVRKDALLLHSIYRLLRKVRPDVFMGYTIKPVVYGLIASRFVGIPRRCALITGLGSAFTAEAEGNAKRAMMIARAMYKLSLKYSHATIFQNPDDRSLFQELHLSRSDNSFVVNGSGVDVDYFAHEPLPPNPIFLCIARFVVDKGIREFAAAAALVRMKYPKARFQLAGWIDEHPFAIQQAELDSWCTKGDVEYLGKLDDVRPAIRGCRFYVLPSYREGTPRTVLEAMSMGRPIITTNAPGCRETVQDGENGFLVSPKSVEELTQAMVKVIEQPLLTEAMAAASRKRAVDRYDVRIVNRDIISHLLKTGA